MEILSKAMWWRTMFGYLPFIAKKIIITQLSESYLCSELGNSERNTSVYLRVCLISFSYCSILAIAYQ